MALNKCDGDMIMASELLEAMKLKESLKEQIEIGEI
jgi:hypothetical protein